MSRISKHALLWLTLASALGIAVELVLERHWTKPSQLIPWVALAFVVASAVALLGTPNSATGRVIRAGLVLVVMAGLVGVVLHTHGNYEAGPLDAVYGERWDSMSVTARWWAAFRQQVGPAPAIVPLVLAQLAAMVAIATLDTRDSEGQMGRSGADVA